MHRPPAAGAAILMSLALGAQPMVAQEGSEEPLPSASFEGARAVRDPVEPGTADESAGVPPVDVVRPGRAAAPGLDGQANTKGGFVRCGCSRSAADMGRSPGALPSDGHPRPAIPRGQLFRFGPEIRPRPRERPVPRGAGLFSFAVEGARRAPSGGRRTVGRLASDGRPCSLQVIPTVTVDEAESARHTPAIVAAKGCRS
jgi:hypothetical protein